MSQAQPPKWADRFLRWYCNPELLEEIQGDIYEIFDREASANSGRARRRFVWNVMRFFRWSNIKRTKTTQRANQMGLVKNYFKVGFRNLSKNWGISLINILGLSIATGMGITVFVYVDMQLDMDNFHTRSANIYQLVNRVNAGGASSMSADVPLLLDELKEKHSGIKDVVRVEFQSGNMRHGDQVFGELVSFVDPGLLQVFDFPMKAGDRQALFNKRQVVVGYNTAEKYFGTGEAVGKDISIKYGNGTIQNYTIGAVLEKTPPKASFSFEVMVPIDNFFDLQLQDHYGWDYFTDAVFIEMKEGRSPDELGDVLAGFVTLQNAADSKLKIENFDVINLNELSLKGFGIDGSISRSGHPAGMVGLSVISAMLILLACFNYMNIAVTAAAKRLKEIALRKVIGGNRRQIIYQFILENVILVSLAMIVGTALSYFFLLPGFNSILPISVPFEFSSLPVLIGFFAGLLLLVGLISGTYPAMYISKFQPAHILKGREKLGSKNFFSRMLLGFQFFFAITTIIGCFIFTENAIYQGEKDWGYNPVGVISVPLVKSSDYNALRDAALANASVEAFAGSKYHIARANHQAFAGLADKQLKTNVYQVGSGYMELMGLRLEQGRFFGKEEAIDRGRSVVVNQKFTEKSGWADPIGQIVTLDSARYRVVGVVEDFMSTVFYEESLPAIFTVATEEEFSHFVVKSKPGDELAVNDYLQSAWAKVAPNDPYNGRFQTDTFDYIYTENTSNIMIISFISAVAMILACLGLFGLLGFSIQSRRKEFGVRKVLGANAWNIVVVASRQYFWTLFIAFAAGAPMGLFLITKMIDAIYPEPKAVGPVPFVLAVSIVMVTVAVTVASQVKSATGVNPAETLRSE